MPLPDHLSFEVSSEKKRCPAIHTRRARQAGPAPEWEPSAEQLNRAPLLSRDPILFYDEVPLYESELDDNGVSQLSVKVQATTPGSWSYTEASE